MDLGRGLGETIQQFLYSDVLKILGMHMDSSTVERHFSQVPMPQVISGLPSGLPDQVVQLST